MKKLFFVLGLIFMTMLINAQQTQSYSGQKSYATEGGYVGGEEQYTYPEDIKMLRCLGRYSNLPDSN